MSQFFYDDPTVEKSHPKYDNW